MTPFSHSSPLPPRSRLFGRVALLVTWLLVLPAAAHGASLQTPPDTTEDVDEETGESGVLIGAGSTGIAFGDRPYVNGVRLTWRGGRMQRVNGVDLTMWKPVDDTRGTVNGLALGFVGPGSERIHGLGAGLGGVVASERIAGLAVGGLGVVVNGSVRGVAAGGLGSVVEGSVIGTVIGGLGAVVDGHLTGAGIGGVGVVVDRDLHGVGVAGVATVVGGDLAGIGVGGGALVTDRRLLGVGASAGTVVADEEISGLALAGYKVESRAVRGIAAAVGRTELEDLQGIGVAAWNQVKGRQTGLVIGIYNDAAELRGVQLGLLNRARNNGPPFEFLPLFNLHLD